MEEIRRSAAREGALARAPGGQFTGLPDTPLVRVRAVYGRAIAQTPTHVLHEWVKAGQYFIRWDEKWQVHKVPPGEWHGEVIDTLP